MKAYATYRTVSLSVTTVFILLFCHTALIAQSGSLRTSGLELPTVQYPQGSDHETGARAGDCSLVVTCPADITVDVDADMCTAVVNVDDPSAENFDCPATMPLTFSHSTDNITIVSGSVACLDNATGFHSENSYLRLYNLEDEGVTTGTFEVTSVRFGVESSSSGSGSLPANVRIYSKDPGDFFTLANLVLEAEESISIDDQEMSFVNVPISASIPAGSDLVVELNTPDGIADMNAFFIGSNDIGQSGPSYILSPTMEACDINEPTPLADIGFPDMHIILDVTGDVPVEGEITLSLTAGLASGTAFPLGTTTNTYMAEDPYGNMQSCSVDITVEDPSGECVDPCNPDMDVPEALCQDVTVQLDAAGTATIAPGDIDNGSADECTAVGFDLDIVSFDCDDVGTANVVTLTVSDDAGNESTCLANVTVEDNVAPVAACMDVTVALNSAPEITISAIDINDGSSDNCMIAGITVEPSTFTMTGTNTVTMTVSDEAGNESSCTAEVAVVTAAFDILQDAGLSVYPNPNAGRFTVEADNLNGSPAMFRIYNALGHAVYQSQTWPQAGRINSSVEQPLDAGFYLLVLENDEGVAIRRVIVY